MCARVCILIFQFTDPRVDFSYDVTFEANNTCTVTLKLMVCRHVYARMHTHTHVRTCTHTHTHTHTCAH